MNSFDCILVQTCYILWEEMKYLLFPSSILCICNCVTWWIILTCKLFLFDFIVLESVLYIGEPFIASSKMSLQRSVACKLHHSNCNVWCGDISDVCYVLSVTVCPLILSLYSDKKCEKSPFQNYLRSMLNITIKVNAYGCRPENGRIPLIVQWYKLVHFMIVLIIDLYLNLFRHLVYTIHISSVA